MTADTATQEHGTPRVKARWRSILGGRDGRYELWRGPVKLAAVYQDAKGWTWTDGTTETSGFPTSMAAKVAAKVAAKEASKVASRSRGRTQARWDMVSRRGEEVSSREIAALAGCSEQNVSDTERRALAKLRSWCERWGLEPGLILEGWRSGRVEPRVRPRYLGTPHARTAKAGRLYAKRSAA